jgi:N-carbamoylputrescine amidase
MPDTDLWSAVAADVTRSAPDVLITNEMPFGQWLAASPSFDADRAKESVRIHEHGLAAPQALKIPIVISSRPVIAGARLANEAFILERGRFRFLHQKHFFPAEEGWFETEWFRTATPGFEVMEIDGLRIGVLLCTELMFNERARAYGKSGAHLVAVPRATGRSLAQWENRWRNGGDRFRVLRSQFEPDRIRFWWACFRRRRLRICAGWFATFRVQ